MTDDALSWTAPLRSALGEAGFTHDAVVGLLGPHAHAALARNETLPALHATRATSPLATLTRLFLLQVPVAAADAERALPGLVDRLCVAGMLEQSVAEVRARLDCRPYATDERDLWVVSDLTPGLDARPTRVGADHVLGISAAATSLAQLTSRAPVGTALDLGTGCGVQALHLAAHARSVVATDVNPRALWLTRVNAALNDLRVETRQGSFFEPVAGERFDLVTSNPPFVISPATGQALVYRDSGLPGDQVVEHLVRGLPALLADGGTAQVLANWVVRRDQPWQERLAGWLEPGHDAWVVQREVVDLPTYVELWLKDSGHHPATGQVTVEDYHRRYDTWLSWLESEGVEAIGFGWINLRASGAGPRAVRRLEEWRYDVEQPIGPEVGELLDRVAALRDLDDVALLGARPATRVDVRQETYGAPGAEDPEEIVLRQQRLLRRARTADTVEAALVGALDGELSVGQVLDALAQLLDREAGELRMTYLPVVRELVAEGFLTLPGDPSLTPR